VEAETPFWGAISTLCCYSKPNICQDRLGTNVGNVERKRLFCRARRTALVALQVLGKRGWLLVLVCRACPFVPYAPSNYIFGLSDVGALTFIVSSVRREKTRLCNEFSLCLSRACLGKMIIFSIKWRKKTPFHWCFAVPFV